VVKIGGRALERAGSAAELGRALGARRDVVLVHGGGAEVSSWCERLGRSSSFVDGRRITDPVTLEVAVAVLAGLTNKRIVAGLRASGIDAVGLAALDGGVVDAVAHPRAHELGEVGAVRGVSAALLESLLAHGRVPVLASIGQDQGRLLNLNADDVAAALAAGLRARALVLLSDVAGVRLGGAIRAHLAADQASAALRGDEVQGGMRAKLEAARLALEAGVPVVHVATWNGPDTLNDLLQGRGAGTSLTLEEVCDV
jgi:acetylglutamate kinase